MRLIFLDKSGKNDSHPVGMSSGDVVTFSHARSRTDYRASEFAFLGSREETSFFLHHCSSSEFGTDARNVSEDGVALGLVHLDMVHEMRKRYFFSRPACVNLVVWPGADLRGCIINLAREADFREESVRGDLDAGLWLDHDTVNKGGFDGDGR